MYWNQYRVAKVGLVYRFWKDFRDIEVEQEMDCFIY